MVKITFKYVVTVCDGNTIKKLPVVVNMLRKS